MQARKGHALAMTKNFFLLKLLFKDLSIFFNLPHVGLEPTHRKALDPKSSASTNSASGAMKLVYLSVTETVNIFIKQFIPIKIRFI